MTDDADTDKSSLLNAATVLAQKWDDLINEEERNLILVGIAAQLVLASVLSSVDQKGMLDEYVHDFRSAAYSCGSSFLQASERIYQLLPTRMIPVGVSTYLLTSAVTRSSDVRAALIALSAATMRLLRELETHEGNLTEEIAPEVMALANQIELTILHMSKGGEA